MLTYIASNGVRTIIVETANRFARDLIVQETGHRMLRGLGIELIAADSPVFDQIARVIRAIAYHGISARTPGVAQGYGRRPQTQLSVATYKNV